MFGAVAKWPPLKYPLPGSREGISINRNSVSRVSVEGLPEFLFEIASDERLGILATVSARPMKHAEIARALSMTGSETTRHLRRLTTTGLIEKSPEGEYGPTQLAETLRTGLPFFEFLVAHRRFLQHHRLPVLDRAFVERLGELTQASLVHGTYQVVALQESSLRAVKRRIWVLTEQRFEQALPIFREKMAVGADIRVIRPRASITEERRTGRIVHRNFPLRVLPNVDTFLAVLDEQAGLCLAGPDGRTDMGTMLLVTDPEGYRWAEDVFLWYWDRAEVWHATGTADPPG